MKKTLSYFFVLLSLSAIILTAGCGSSTLSKKEYVIATGSKSGVYYPIGVTLKEQFAKKFPGVTLNVLETGGSVENIEMLNNQKVDMALIQNDISYYAVQGEAMFNGNKIQGLSGIATLFPEVIQIIVRKDREIHSLADLSGKKIAVGNKDSGTYYNAQQILTLANVWQEIQPQYINFGESIKAIEAGTIDGFFFTSGLPNPSISVLAEKLEIAIVPVKADLVMNLVNTYSFYYPSTIPANTYKGQQDAIEGVEISAIVVSGALLSENDQYLITKNIFTEANELGKSNPRLSKITKTALRRQMPVLTGEGARRAYSEVP